MRAPGVNLQPPVLKQLNSRERASLDGHHLVIIALDDEHGDAHALEVPPQIRLPAPQTVVGGLEPRLHALPEPIVDHALAFLGPGAIESKERPRGHV